MTFNFQMLTVLPNTLLIVQSYKRKLYIFQFSFGLQNFLDFYFWQNLVPPCFKYQIWYFTSKSAADIWGWYDWGGGAGAAFVVCWGGPEGGIPPEFVVFCSYGLYSSKVAGWVLETALCTEGSWNLKKYFIRSHFLSQ